MWSDCSFFGWPSVKIRFAKSDSNDTVELQPLSSLPIHIVSENNFPTAAGLASSASGFAALVYTIATLYQLPSSPSELSKIARTGSGSACRSLFGGYVAWEMGAQTDGEDSLAVQVAPVEHWSEMDAIVCVVSDAKKGTPSTAGMQQTIATSALAEHRIKYVVPERMTLISDAIKNHDFDMFAQITMKDSNQFHAICLDTDPPIFYLNDVSRAIITAVTELNRASLAAGQGYLAAYTFDAGPNAVIYALRKNSKAIVNLITRYFPIEYDDKQKLFAGANEKPGTLPLPTGFNSAVIPTFPSGSVKEIIHSRVGDGPRKLGGESSLIGSNGLPKKLAGQ